ncbi:hypothetical protein, partial [Pseudoflavonifractor phocaeensis]|uniref:hypothetical protein n=1 Tax=Pseudoflavonifractor phocaeensis TaxID=1870988 RepID=UPI00195A533B
RDSIKTAQRAAFMEFSHCHNAYFHWCVETHQWKVQGFWTKLSKNLALEQSHFALKALGFKACGFVQYAL